MTEVADFIDAALRYEVSPYSWPHEAEDGLERYGTSVGAIRGTVRDALRKFPRLSHDEVTALSSELWVRPVFERRAAALVLLQTRVADLIVTDLTRLEGFIRTAGAGALIDQLVSDVLEPMVARLRTSELARATTVFERWARESDGPLRDVAGRVTPSI